MAPLPIQQQVPLHYVYVLEFSSYIRAYHINNLIPSLLTILPTPNSFKVNTIYTYIES